MQIEARIIAHGKSAITGKEIVTFELQYPRLIHSEFMTHRLFSRNAASSRAIPVQKIIEMVRKSPAMPVRFGANQPGMQDKGMDHDALVFAQELGDEFGVEMPARLAWAVAAENACQLAEEFHAAGYHKQIANRLLEPFQWMKTVMTATELDNWFWLRDHVDADPTIDALAKAMWKALEASEPVTLLPGMWHVPYFGDGYWREEYEDGDLADALAISSSCCAQVSYRKLDDTLEKAHTVYERLVGSEPVHASPFEHQATPMQGLDWEETLTNIPAQHQTWELGVTHVDRNGDLWSGNFKHFIQHRQLIPNNACWNYEGKE